MESKDKRGGLAFHGVFTVNSIDPLVLSDLYGLFSFPLPPHFSAVVVVLRFLEAAFWSLEHDGRRLSDLIEESIAWRESTRANRLGKEDVFAQGSSGTILVKGHDLDRCGAMWCVAMWFSTVRRFSLVQLRLLPALRADMEEWMITSLAPCLHARFALELSLVGRPVCCLLFVCRRRPVVYFRPAIGCRLEGDGNSKLMIYNLERAIRLMPRNSWQYTIIIDCHGENNALVAVSVSSSY